MSEYAKHTLGGILREYMDRDLLESGFKINWTTLLGHKLTVHYTGTNFDDIKRMAIEDAKRMGWTPPKWWQWWRWTDTRIDEA